MLRNTLQQKVIELEVLENVQKGHYQALARRVGEVQGLQRELQSVFLSGTGVRTVLERIDELTKEGLVRAKEVLGEDISAFVKFPSLARTGSQQEISTVIRKLEELQAKVGHKLTSTQEQLVNLRADLEQLF